jgi:dolichol-phosphate mannosyltransferase
LWKNRNGFDMIVGRKVHRNEEAYRLILAKGFHTIVNGVFNLNLHDADCGFRLIRKEVVLSILDDIKHLKYSFWAEFTIKACYKGFKICEVPINHNYRANGNTHIYKLAEIPNIILKQLNGLLSLHFDIRANR